MKKYWKSWMMVVAVMVLALAAACSSGVQSENGSTQANDGETKEQTQEPKEGGKIAMPIVGDPIFNPWHPNAFAESNIVNRIIFSGLTKPGKDLAPAPSLASEWSASEDGTVWTFNLREGVKWHDGEEFNAEDVAFTFNDIVLNEELGANGASDYKAVEKVEIVDPYTVEFHLKRPWAALPAFLGFNSEIIPEHIFAGKEDPWSVTSFNKDTPIGTGAFKVKDYISGQSVVLESNENFYAGRPYLDTVEYKILADVNTHIAQALSNELDYFVLQDKASLQRVESAQNLSISPQETTKYYWISTNIEDEKFQDAKVRQAMLHAIDRKAIIDSVLKGYATIADAAIAKNLKTYYTDDVKRYAYDPDKARELLAEAGWEDTNGDGIIDKDGEPFQFRFDVAIQGDLVPVAQLVQQYLKEIGMGVELNTMEWNTMIQDVVIERDYEVTMNWWAYPSDPDVLAQYHSDGAGTGNNIPGYQNPELDQLLEQGQGTSDSAERKEIYTKAQKLMAEELPYIYLWYPNEISVKNDRLKGTPELYYGGALHYINEWYVE